MQVTLEILKALCPKRETAKLQSFLDMHLLYGGVLQLNTVTRLQYFLAQIAHETGCFRAISEDDNGLRYEGNKNLGNIQKGDGPKFKGGGDMQLTGRWNYTDFGKWLKKNFPDIQVDVVKNPEIVRTDRKIAYLTVPYFWLSRKLNTYADAEDKNGHPAGDPFFNFNNLTERINGGQNGATDRTSKLRTIKSILI